MHIRLYRARKQYRDLVTAIAAETARRLPDVQRLAELRVRRDEARERALEIELAMAATSAAPA